MWGIPGGPVLGDHEDSEVELALGRTRCVWGGFVFRAGSEEAALI